MRKILLVLLLLAPVVVWGNAGRILFVSGAVTVERDGKLYRAVRSARLKEGDVIDTGRVGRVHFRMADRTLMSLKPETTFVVEEFRYGAPQAEEPETAPAPAQPRRQEREQDRSVFRLLKGGFRAITGLIGQRDQSAFGVNTPVATIGIRGTSFVAELTGGPAAGTVGSGDVLDPARHVQLAQAGGGQNLDLPPQTLTVGVTDGAVVLTTPLGSLVLRNGEFGQVVGRSLPRRLTRPLPDADTGAGDDEDGEAADAESDEMSSLLSRQRAVTDTELGVGLDGGVPPFEADEIVTPETEPRASQNLALVSNLSANGANAQVLTLADTATATDDNGLVTGFLGAVDRNGSPQLAEIRLSGGEVGNRGGDPALELSWGIWSGGSVIVDPAAGPTQTLPTDSVDLHLIQSASGAGRIVVPTTGSREFVLVGNTDPTSGGLSGFLGEASLSANFDTQSVNSSLWLSVNQQFWEASGTGSLGSALSAGTPANVFSGQYGVSVDNLGGGMGEFSGFFTDRADAAGLSYRLEHGDSTVHGTAAFAAPGL